MLLIKVRHGNESKRFRNNSCYFTELLNSVNGLKWASDLPAKFHFYYLDEGDMIQIDNQHDMNEAIKTIFNEQKSTTLKLILAQTQQEAIDV